MGAGRVLCDDVLRRRMRTCEHVLSVNFIIDTIIENGLESLINLAHSSVLRC